MVKKTLHRSLEGKELVYVAVGDNCFYISLDDLLANRDPEDGEIIGVYESAVTSAQISSKGRREESQENCPV